MKIEFYNTLNHGLEEFRPESAGSDPQNPIAGSTVQIYSCGPTVYDYAHIGNFRAFIFADVLCRFLKLCGAKVLQVMNMTDVGHMTEDDRADGAGLDKLAVAVQKMKVSKQTGTAPVDDPGDPFQVADYFAREFLVDARALRLDILHRYDRAGAAERERIMPRPTRHIDSFIKLIQALLDAGSAYVGTDGVVYFDISSFPAYGRLSGNSIERLSHGAGGRTADQAGKKHPADFFLWKPDAHHIMRWPSPWGEGYPGWHIECSAMAMEFLGSTLDIHTGGEDNIFPHHECEIAQSQAYTHQTFSNFWMHTRHLMVDGEKMSKSRGNFYTIRDLTAKGFDPLAIRFALLSTRYRESMNFSIGALHDAAAAVETLRELSQRMMTACGAATGEVYRDAATAAPAAMAPSESQVLKDFMGQLADDLNMAGAVGVLFAWVAEIGKIRPIAAERGASALALLAQVDRVLDVIFAPLQPLPDEKRRAIDELAALRTEARHRKDFTTSDRLRDEIRKLGAEVQDSAGGSTWRARLSPAR